MYFFQIIILLVKDVAEFMKIIFVERIVHEIGVWKWELGNAGKFNSDFQAPISNLACFSLELFDRPFCMFTQYEAATDPRTFDQQLIPVIRSLPEYLLHFPHGIGI